MKTKKISRILEGCFLFSLILMIYMLSIFSAKGQMVRELVTPYEFTLSYSNEQSFIQERVYTKQLLFQTEPKTINNFTKLSDERFIPDYISESIQDDSTKIYLPEIDLRRRKLKEYQAPYLTIPIN